MITSPKSGYIESQAKGTAEEVMRLNLNIDQQLDVIIDKLQIYGPKPPVPYMQIIGSCDENHFFSNMKLFAIEILCRCKATPNSTILDLGCGCGRLALPICNFLSDGTGSYVGVDVWNEGINWCKENISSISPRFSFNVVNSVNNYYFNDSESIVNNNYSLSFMDNASMDIVFSISLFTHLRRNDALDYLKEISRVLKPNGVAYITCFIIDHYFFEYRARTGNHSAVVESNADHECFYAYSYQDFFAGFSMKAWNAMLAESGLWALCYETGNWAEKPGSRLYQDTFILAKI